MNQITVGSVVRLKSNDTPMTVDKIYDHNSQSRASCVWFKDEDAKEGSFAVTSLIRHEEYNDEGKPI